MKIQKLLVVVAALFVVGCAGTTPDDTDTQEDDYQTVGETDSSGDKADNISGKSVGWKADREIEMEGTSHSGTVEVVSTNPKVQVRSESIIFEVDELPAELNIEADEGLVSTKELNFAVFSRPHEEADWQQLKWEGTRTRTRSVQRDRCDGMAGAAQDDCFYDKEYTEEYDFWRFQQMTLGEDEIAFGDGETFANPLADLDSFQLRVVPIPYGKLIGLEGTYDYAFTAECFGTVCGTE